MNNIKHLEIAHNKKVTVFFSLLCFIVIVAFILLISLILINKSNIAKEIGLSLLILSLVFLSLCTLWFIIIFINQVYKLKRKVIFKVDEEGIYDYSRYIVLAPITWDEIKSIEYKGVLSDDVSDFSHLKIILKNSHEYSKKLNLLQKISYRLRLNHIEIHLFCGKAKKKEIITILKNNLEIFNSLK